MPICKTLLNRVVFILIGILGMMVAPVQGQSVFRIGVLNNADDALLQGAQLAVQEINEAGGVIGADGTRFQFELVVQPTNNIENAVGNLQQADVIAVIGPEDSRTTLANRDLLTSLNVPIMTAADDDSITANDASGLFFRIRARQFLQAQALADYLVNDLSAASVSTVQLDVASTVGVVGFTRAAANLGLTPRDQDILADDTTLDSIIQTTLDNRPQFLVAYGPEQTAAQLYNQLRDANWAGRFVYNQADHAAFRDQVETDLLEGIISNSTWSYTYGDTTSQDFTLAYLRAFNDVPAPVDAAAYDAVYLLQAAIGQPGNLSDNLNNLREFEGVQGLLSPAELQPRGEISANTAVLELNEFGAPVAVARYRGSEQITLADTEIVQATPTPSATPTLEGVFLRVTRAVQNVRTGPGLNYDILGQLQEGDTARVIGATVDFEWVAIQFRGTNGWLFRDILDIVGDTTTVPVLTPPPTPTPPPATATPTREPFPDLVVVSATPNRLTIGQPFSVTVTIRNQGAVNAGPFAVAASFMPGSVYDAVNLGGLAANTQTTITLDGTLGTGPTGSKDVGIVVDLNGQVNEGVAGENNNVLSYIYTADAPLLTTAPATGTLTLSDSQTTQLDSASQDFQWSIGNLVPLGNTRLARLNGFTQFENIHRDAVAAAPLQNTDVVNVQAGEFIAIQTDSQNKYGVLEIISATSGGQLTFRFRMYD